MLIETKLEILFWAFFLLMRRLAKKYQHSFLLTVIQNEFCIFQTLNCQGLKTFLSMWQTNIFYLSNCMILEKGHKKDSFLPR